MRLKTTLIILVALAVSATVAFAADDPKLVAACKADVSKLHKEITAVHSTGLKSLSIDDAEEKAYQAHKTKLDKIETTLSKGGLTLKECKELEPLLKSELAEVTKMAAANSAAQKTAIAKNVKAQTLTFSMFAKAKAHPQFTGQFKAQIDEHEKAMAADKAKLDKILSAGGAKQAEHATLEKSSLARNEAVKKLLDQHTAAPAADDPKQIAACKADVSKLQKEITAAHSAGLKLHSINDAEEKAFQAHMARIGKLEADLNKGGLTLNECKELQQVSKSELAEVVKMAAANSTNQKVAIAKHTTTHAKLVSAISKAKTSPKLPAQAKVQIAEHEKALAADKAKLDKIQAAGGAKQAEHATLEKSLFTRNEAIMKLLAEHKIQ